MYASCYIVKCLDEAGIEALAFVHKFSIYDYTKTVGTMQNSIMRTVM